MEQTGSNNILGLLRELSAHPQRAASAVRILADATADLDSNTRMTIEHTAAEQQAAKAHQDTTAALRLQDRELTVLTPKVHALGDDFSRLNLQGQMAIPPMREIQESFRALTPEISAATTQTEQHTSAVQRAALALRSQAAVGIEMVGKGLAGIVAGRKAQAGMEAVWETARGIALLAEGTWPPNPAAIAAAGLHFEAAAQYALLAGSGSHRRSAGAGGGGGYGSGTGHGSGESRSGPPMQTLAPGAASPSLAAGSGVVIIRGTQAFEDYVAGAVNGAVSRGVSVTATTSQRGAPVGH